MAFSTLCPPALIYLVFSITQIVIDTVKGQYNTAMFKLLISLLFVVLLNSLCANGLGIVSWVIVFVPFIFMTVIVSILLVMFGLDPGSGRLKVYDRETKILDTRQEQIKQNQVELASNKNNIIDKAKNTMDAVNTSTASIVSNIPTGSEEIDQTKYKKFMLKHAQAHFENPFLKPDNKDLEEREKDQQQEKNRQNHIRTAKMHITMVKSILKSLVDDSVASEFETKASECLDMKEPKDMDKCYTKALQDIMFKMSPEKGIEFATRMDDLVSTNPNSPLKANPTSDPMFTEKYNNYTIEKVLANIGVNDVAAFFKEGVEKCMKMLNLDNRVRCHNDLKADTMLKLDDDKKTQFLSKMKDLGALVINYT
jgi:hypothetical protein